MIKSAKFNESGAIVVVIDDEEMVVPDDRANRHRQLLAEWEVAGNEIEAYSPPTETGGVISVPSVILWERLTEAEAEQVNAAMATQPFRTRQIFLTANTFRSDHELWPLLMNMATDLFGQARADQLLSIQHEQS
ncbi:hypothetical protein [Brucella anthropi]|uniref:hypothetical protein n=1 Tax=Brucella anthropi TaxID=529 RepID=UPI000A480337|nr:hypothetical protein [Brucella anthropi]